MKQHLTLDAQIAEFEIEEADGAFYIHGRITQQGGQSIIFADGQMAWPSRERAEQVAVNTATAIMESQAKVSLV